MHSPFSIHIKEYDNNKENRVVTHRNMIKKTFFDKGIDSASELSLKNCKDLFEIVKWNKKNNFNFFRMSSDMFPWCSEYKITDLPDYKQIAIILKEIGKYINDNNLRVTSHPGPFNVLTSPKEHVVKNCIHDLTIHGKHLTL